MRMVVIAILLAGCERTSALYCEKNPDKCMAMIDAPIASVCTTDQQCVDHANGRPFCIDTTSCGQCRTSADCMEPTATCELTTHDCRGCKLNSECPSDVCLDTGACAPLDQVAYVGGSGSGKMCTMAAPCATIADAEVLTPPPRYIRLVADVVETIILNTNDFFDILGSGFTIHTKPGIGFRIGDQARIVLTNLEIAPSALDTNPSDDCILVDSGTPTLRLAHVNIHDCGGDTLNINAGTVLIDNSVLHNSAYGVEVFSSATVGISHTTIHHIAQSGITVNTSANTTTVDASVIAFNGSGNGDTPGVDINGTVKLTNTIIARNGSSSASVGGVRVNSGTATLDFVTIADNITIALPAKGMYCGAGATAVVTNSIITGNLPSAATSCLPAFSLLDGMSTTVSNRMGAPMFITGITNPTDLHFYRLQSTSLAIDGADPLSTVAKDIDGEPRLAGHADMGADEYHP